MNPSRESVEALWGDSPGPAGNDDQVNNLVAGQFPTRGNFQFIDGLVDRLQPFFPEGCVVQISVPAVVNVAAIDPAGVNEPLGNGGGRGKVTLTFRVPGHAETGTKPSVLGQSAIKGPGSADALRSRGIHLLWNVAHRSALQVFSRLAYVLDDVRIIGWLPEGDLPRVMDHVFTSERDVPSALGKTAFNNPEWWDAVRENAREAATILLVDKAHPSYSSLEHSAEWVWVETPDFTLRHIKNRNGGLMAPFVLGKAVVS